MRKLISVILLVSLKYLNFFHNQKALPEDNILEVLFLLWNYRIGAYATSKLIAPACLHLAGSSLTSERYRSGYSS